MRAMLHRKWLRKRLLGTVLVLGLSTHGASSDDGWMPDLHVAAGGQLMFVRPDDFGLAVHRHQLPVQSTIPPCDEGFDYCLYYLGGQFAGTNFRNAGIRIERRDDLETAASCLSTPPRGYVELQPVIRRDEGFAVSIFAPLFEGAVGHYAEGQLYRLALEGGACFEVETRIGAAQFGHFPEGTIREFTREDRDALAARLRDVVRAIRLVDRPDVVLFE